VCRGGFDTSGIGQRRLSLPAAEASQRPSGEKAKAPTSPPAPTRRCGSPPPIRLRLGLPATENWWAQVEASLRVRWQWIDAPRSDKARAQFLRYRDKEHFLADCTTFVVMRELRFYAARAAQEGRLGAKSGAVSVVQRTSSDLRLNPHLHLVVLDGAWYEEGGELAWEGSGSSGPARWARCSSAWSGASRGTFAGPA
jgi:hypothetical protein